MCFAPQNCVERPVRNRNGIILFSLSNINFSFFSPHLRIRVFIYSFTKKKIYFQVSKVAYGDIQRIVGRIKKIFPYLLRWWRRWRCFDVFRVLLSGWMVNTSSIFSAFKFLIWLVPSVVVGNAFNSSDVLKNACIDFVAFDAVCEASRPCFRAECLFFVGGVVDSSLNIWYSRNLTYKIFFRSSGQNLYPNIFFFFS